MVSLLTTSVRDESLCTYEGSVRADQVHVYLVDACTSLDKKEEEEE